MSIINSGLDALSRAEAAIDKTASRIARMPLSAESAGGEDVVDISAEAVALMTSQRAYEAALKLIETGDELQQSTLDVLG